MLRSLRTPKAQLLVIFVALLLVAAPPAGGLGLLPNLLAAVVPAMVTVGSFLHQLPSVVRRDLGRWSPGGYLSHYRRRFDAVIDSLKKLVALGVITSEKRGKEVVFFTTSKGQEYIQRYREIREACLVSSLSVDGSVNLELGELARFLRGLSGLYDQAARAAASL